MAYKAIGDFVIQISKTWLVYWLAIWLFTACSSNISVRSEDNQGSSDAEENDDDDDERMAPPEVTRGAYLTNIKDAKAKCLLEKVPGQTDKQQVACKIHVRIVDKQGKYVYEKDGSIKTLPANGKHEAISIDWRSISVKVNDPAGDLIKNLTAKVANQGLQATFAVPVEISSSQLIGVKKVDVVFSDSRIKEQVEEAVSIEGESTEEPESDCNQEDFAAKFTTYYNYPETSVSNAAELSQAVRNGALVIRITDNIQLDASILSEFRSEKINENHSMILIGPSGPKPIISGFQGQSGLFGSGCIGIRQVAFHNFSISNVVDKNALGMLADSPKVVILESVEVIDSSVNLNKIQGGQFELPEINVGGLFGSVQSLTVRDSTLNAIHVDANKSNGGILNVGGLVGSFETLLVIDILKILSPIFEKVEANNAHVRLGGAVGMRPQGSGPSTMSVRNIEITSATFDTNLVVTSGENDEYKFHFGGFMGRDNYSGPANGSIDFPKITGNLIDVVDSKFDQSLGMVFGRTYLQNPSEFTVGVLDFGASIQVPIGENPARP